MVSPPEGGPLMAENHRSRKTTDFPPKADPPAEEQTPQIPHIPNEFNDCALYSRELVPFFGTGSNSIAVYSVTG